MAGGTFPDPVTSYSTVKVALINKIEIKKMGENVSQYTDFGPLEAGGELVFESLNQKLSGGRFIPIAYKVTFKGVLICSGVNMRTAISTLINTEPDVRFTDINGQKWSLLSTEFGLAIGEEVKGDGDNSIKYPVAGGGTVSATRFNALFSPT